MDPTTEREETVAYIRVGTGGTPGLFRNLDNSSPKPATGLQLWREQPGGPNFRNSLDSRRASPATVPWLRLNQSLTIPILAKPYWQHGQPN